MYKKQEIIKLFETECWQLTCWFPAWWLPDLLQFWLWQAHLWGFSCNKDECSQLVCWFATSRTNTIICKVTCTSWQVHFKQHLATESWWFLPLPYKTRTYHSQKLHGPSTSAYRTRWWTTALEASAVPEFQPEGLSTSNSMYHPLDQTKHHSPYQTST